MAKAKNSSLNKAAVVKEDEFYTQLSDIEKELRHYKEQFKNKIVLCNCDDPDWSNFWMYFKLNFDFLGLKKLISTHYDANTPTYKLEYDGKKVKKTDLSTNGDFRSPECIKLLEEADIVCTNPPFSLFREYVAKLIEYDKKFLIIGNQNNITYKEIFPLIKDNKLWLGYYSGDMAFKVPDYYEARETRFWIDENGQKWRSFGNITWFTNLDTTKRHEELILYKNYTPEEYPKYDNYNAIEVSKIAEIPIDYDGIMGVPITFLDKYNPDQFELLGLTSGRKEFDECSYPTKRYENALQHNRNGSTANGSKANTRATIAFDKKPIDTVYYTADNSDKYLTIVYARVLIRRKKK